MTLLSRINRKLWKMNLQHTLEKLSSCGTNVNIEEPLSMDWSHIQIGNNSHILYGARMLNVSGDDDVKIQIGERTGIQYGFTVLAGSDVTIGNDVSIASNVFISSGSHGISPEGELSYGCQPYTGKPVKIKDGAWLGEKVCVLSGVTIGEKSIIGAGGVVTHDISDFCIAVGNPAKVIKKYNFEKHQWEKVDE